MIKRCLFALALLPLQLLAEEAPSPWYEVEIILFERQNEQAQHKEILAEQAVIPEIIGAKELTPPFIPEETENTPQQAAYQRLRDDQLSLKPEARRIDGASDLKLLMHLGWRQPGLEKNIAPAILIYPYDLQQKITLDEYLGKTSPLSPLSPEATPQDPTMASEEEHARETTPTAAWLDEDHVFGYIRLFISRYLHIESNLLLSIPIEFEAQHLLMNNLAHSPELTTNQGYFMPLQTLEEEPRIPLRNEPEKVIEHHYFHIDESRRVRKSELHYFDHPRFGMLIRVQGYELDEALLEPDPLPEPEAPSIETPPGTPTQNGGNGGMVQRAPGTRGS